MGTKKNVADIIKKILILFYKKRLTLLPLCSIIVSNEYISITYIYIFFAIYKSYRKCMKYDTLKKRSRKEK